MIKITKELEACLHVVKHLAMRGQGVPVPRKDIAEATGISYGFLQGPVNHLRRAGIIKSSYGRNGGLVLMRDPKEITLLEIVNACSANKISVRKPDLYSGDSITDFTRDIIYNVARCSTIWKAANLVD